MLSRAPAGWPSTTPSLGRRVTILVGHALPWWSITRALAALLMSSTVSYVHAADPQPYTVNIEQTEITDLDQAIQDASVLLGLKDKVPVGPFALLARAREDHERFVTALRSFGYYEGKVTVRVANRSLDDPDLPDLLDLSPTEPPVEVQIAIQAGPQFRLGEIEFEGDLPSAARAKFGLASGDAALAPTVLAAREQLEKSLKALGYPLAKVDAPVGLLREDSDTLDLNFKVDSGPRANFGTIETKGLDKVDEAFVERRLPLHPGDRYDPAALDQARKDLMSTGVFSSVRVHPAQALDSEGRLPIEFQFSERPRRAVNLHAAYSTDLGASLAAGWHHRNLGGRAEQLSLSAGITQLGGNSTTGIGYNLAGQVLKPDFIERDQTLQADLGAVKQSLTAYDRQAFTGGLLVTRRFGKHWNGSAGIAAEQSHIVQEGEAHNYTLVSLPVTARYDNTDNLLDPARGTRASLTVSPTQPLAGPETSPFVNLQIAGSTYLDLAEPGRSILALRGTIGLVEGANALALPPDKRYYAGGSATVRGFKYQSIGPRFSSGSPKGGNALVAATVELRQRFLDDYGVAAFLDAGQVTEDGALFTGTPQLSAGLGARYYTGLGPIRLDVAVPVTRQPGSGSFEVYIGLGQAF